MAKKILVGLILALTLTTCFMLTACDNNNIDVEHQHVHKYEQAWQRDSKQHWHLSLCTEEGCPKTSEKQDHDFINGVCYICKYENSSAGRQDPAKTAGFVCQDTTTGYTLMDFSTAIRDLEVETYDGKYITQIMSGITNGKNYKSLKSITLGDHVQTVGMNAFEGCTNLEEVIIKNCAVSIGENAFADCVNLKKVTIGNKAVAFYSNAFAGCTALSSEGEVHIADINSWSNIRFLNAAANPLSLAKKLYVGDELVENVVLPNNLKEINDYAFYNCSNIKSVVIPGSVTMIGKDAFNDCIELENVEFLGSLSDWCKIFFYTRNSNPIAFAKKLYIDGKLLENADIPEGVYDISNFAFTACESIKKVSLPKSLLTIGDGVFADAINIAEVKYMGSADEWKQVAIGKNNENWLGLLQ